MSKLSIYETGWIDFVFQDRNKEYGAYQLRQESTKTTLRALFFGVSVLVTAISVPAIVRAINPSEITKPLLPEIIETTINVTDIVRVEEPIQRALPPVKNQVANPVENVPFVNPVVVATDQATQDIPTTAAIIENTPTASEGSGTIGVNSSTSTGATTGTLPSTDAGNTAVVSAALDKLPEFPGGINKFYTYVGNNFEKQEIDGSGIIKIYVAFVIERDGSMTDITVKRDPGHGLGREAIRVLKSLRTKWAPGMIDGKPVRTAYSLPIVVQLN
ncbi:energy transducer TonB [Flavobacterium turcicum]|uniref:Energy transducer TonB n=1 Tax=Flavobacterium turcicum TaxID=2764718 RepID=A0ABR7JH18_9FLAO|nr:energy transducer TonB [Flavobacterium turcicum]MBC5863546.1 energy transducer TonB [Flavobacterium turcicum]NHL02504.1 hypothetical protein [Flavobacterium turcicum]